MVSFNKVIIGGNMTRDPELRFTNGGTPVANFGLAVNRVRSSSEEVDFFDVTAWRELAETVANYKKKGDPILVEGRLQQSTWEAQDGSRRSKVEVVAQSVQFLGGGQGRANANGEDGAAHDNDAPRSRHGSGRRSTSGVRGAADVAPEEVDDDDFDDIPFRAAFPRRPVLF